MDTSFKMSWKTSLKDNAKTARVITSFPLSFVRQHFVHSNLLHCYCSGKLAELPSTKLPATVWSSLSIRRVPQRQMPCKSSNLPFSCGDHWRHPATSYPSFQ